jgi:aspartate/methionine/tyrosine aminotransferase
LDANVPYSYPSAFLDYVASSLLEDHEFVRRYVAENRQRLTENYIFVAGFLKKHGLRFSRGSNAGFFIWVDLGEALLRRRGADHQKPNTTNGHAKKPGEAARQDSLTEQVMELLVSKKVYLARGDAFGSESPG